VETTGGIQTVVRGTSQATTIESEARAIRPTEVTEIAVLTRVDDAVGAGTDDQTRDVGCVVPMSIHC